MPLVDLTIEGLRDVEQDLAAMRARAADETPAMEAIQVVMIRSAHENFVAGGRPTWQPLSAATVKRRRNEDKVSIQILRDTGLLMLSLFETPNQYSVREVTPQSVAIGTNRPGASAHQEGSSRLPARPFLIHQPQDIKDYKQIILDHITGFGE